jgi:recombination DNA repair RAD52 pathway protein
MNGRLTQAQIGILMQPIRGARVANRQQGGKTLSYLEAYDVRAHLIRIFGFGGFDAEILDYDLVFVRDYENNDKPMQEIAYKARMQLTIRDRNGDAIARYTECAVGSASGGSGFGDLHDNALKSAVSDALKRCAINLGSQFGLSLYDKDNGRAEVVRQLVEDPRGEQPGVTLSDEQRAALSNSLGATEVMEGNTDDGVPGSTSEPDGVPAATAG